MTRTRFSPAGIPWRRIACCVVMVVNLLSVALAMVLVYELNSKGVLP
jgi:hypothetical protein